MRGGGWSVFWLGAQGRGTQAWDILGILMQQQDTHSCTDEKEHRSPRSEFTQDSPRLHLQPSEGNRYRTQLAAVNNEKLGQIL